MVGELIIFLLLFSNAEGTCQCLGEIIQDHCYQLYNLTEFDWVTADETCQRDGGHMAHFTDEVQTNEVQAYLMKNLKSLAYIGVTVANAETERLALVCPNNAYYGLMSQQLADFLVADNYTDSHRCSYISNETFKIVFGACDNEAQVLCDRPVGAPDYCNIMMNCTQTTYSPVSGETTKMIIQPSGNMTTTVGRKTTVPSNGGGNNGGGGSGNDQPTTPTLIPLLTTTSENGGSGEDKSCRKGGVSIWGWCIPWWLLALLGLLLLLLLLCCCCWLCCFPSMRKKEKEVVTEYIDPPKVPCQEFGTQVDLPVEVGPPPIPAHHPPVMIPVEPETREVHIPYNRPDSDDKGTMTDFLDDPPVVTNTIEVEKIVEIEKIIYQPGPLLPTPKPASAHRQRIENIEIEEILPDPLEIHPIEPQVQLQIETENEPPSPKHTMIPIPLPDMPKKVRPNKRDWKHNRRNVEAFEIPVHDQPFDDDDAPAFRFAPKKPAPIHKRPSHSAEHVTPLPESPPLQRFLPHNEAPKVDVVHVGRDAKPIPKLSKSPSRKRPKFRPSGDVEILKIGTPMSLPRTASDHPSRRSTQPSQGRPRKKEQLSLPSINGSLSPQDRNGVSKVRTPQARELPRSVEEGRTGNRLPPERSRSLSRSRESQGGFGSLMQAPSQPMRTTPDPFLKTAEGRMGGVAGKTSRNSGWKPWAKVPKTFSDKPAFLDYD